MRYNQLLDPNTADPLGTLCEKINDFFVGLTSPLSPLISADVSRISVDVIPEDLFSTVREVQGALNSNKVRRSPGPDGIPNVLLKSFSFELARVICELYNSSIRWGKVLFLHSSSQLVSVLSLRRGLHNLSITILDLSPWLAKYQKSWKGLHYLGSRLPFLRISTLSSSQLPENQLNRLLLIFSILY